jgi:hypothetical protein
MQATAAPGDFTLESSYEQSSVDVCFETVLPENPPPGNIVTFAVMAFARGRSGKLESVPLVWGEKLDARFSAVGVGSSLPVNRGHYAAVRVTGPTDMKGTNNWLRLPNGEYLVIEISYPRVSVKEGSDLPRMMDGSIVFDSEYQCFARFSEYGTVAKHAFKIQCVGPTIRVLTSEDQQMVNCRWDSYLSQFSTQDTKDECGVKVFVITADNTCVPLCSQWCAHPEFQLGKCAGSLLGIAADPKITHVGALSSLFCAGSRTQIITTDSPICVLEWIPRKLRSSEKASFDSLLEDNRMFGCVETLESEFKKYADVHLEIFKVNFNRGPDTGSSPAAPSSATPDSPQKP